MVATVVRYYGFSTPVFSDGQVFMSVGQDPTSRTVAAIPKKIAEIDMGDSVHSTPVPANGVLYVMTQSALYAITAPISPKR
jgi:hypothetical protein